MAERKVPLEVTSLGVLTFISILIVSTYGGCEFKHDWAGQWYIHGTSTILSLNITHMESKGRCVATRHDKFIVVDPSESCYRCLVIHEKHINVLQFKETYCDTTDNIDTLCGQLAGDSVLYSMFRTEPLNGPIPCPFKGPSFTFTYTRGALGECSVPLSRMDTCTDDSRLSLKYQACPDIPGTESAVEELVCMATWKEGSVKFLMAKIYHYEAEKAVQESYRCYLYDRLISHDHRIMYYMSASNEPACNELSSAKDGSKVLRITKVDNSHTKCKYPSWITEHHHWHTLDYKKSYHFSHKNATLKITEDETHGGSRSLSVPGNGIKKPGYEMRVVCHSEIKTDSHYSIITAHVTSGCDSGYVCLAFYRRDSTVIEIQQSTKLVENPGVACNPNYFDPSNLPFVTLITGSLLQRKCPHLGRYALINLTEEKEGFGKSDGEDETGTEEPMMKQVVSEDPTMEEPTPVDPYLPKLPVLEKPVPIDMTHPKMGIAKDPIMKDPSGRAPRLARVKRESSTVAEVEETKEECEVEKFDGLNIGCSRADDVMEFESDCGADFNLEYSCYGSWEENGVYYLIASPSPRKSTESRRYCFIFTPFYENYEEGEEGASERSKKRSVGKFTLSTVVGSCPRSLLVFVDEVKSFNFTLIGACKESKSSENGSNVPMTTFLFVMSVLTLLLSTR